MRRRPIYGARLRYDLARGLEEAKRKALGPGSPDNPADLWWRIDDCSYATSTEGDEYRSTGPVIEAHAYAVVRRTPKGVWLSRSGAPTWVGTNWRRRFAAPSVAEAFKDYIARRTRQQAICQAQADRAGSLADEADRLLQKYLQLGACNGCDPLP